MVKRRNVHEFLANLVKKHYVMVWSSAQPENVDALVRQSFTPDQVKRLVAVWGRDTLHLSKKEYFSKVQCYKRLEWVWEDATIRERFDKVWIGDPAVKGWDQTNTVLIDDSEEKARAQPHNLIRVPEFTKQNRDEKGDVLGQVLCYLDAIVMFDDVSSAICAEPFEPGVLKWDWNAGKPVPREALQPSQDSPQPSKFQDIQPLPAAEA